MGRRLKSVFNSHLEKAFSESIQGSWFIGVSVMGQGMPLSLSGVRQITEAMDWGDAEEFVKFGEIRGSEVDECAYYILVCPQNMVGSTILTDLSEMVRLQLRI